MNSRRPTDQADPEEWKAALLLALLFVLAAIALNLPEIIDAALRLFGR